MKQKDATRERPPMLRASSRPIAPPLRAHISTTLAAVSPPAASHPCPSTFAPAYPPATSHLCRTTRAFRFSCPLHALLSCVRFPLSLLILFFSSSSPLHPPPPLLVVSISSRPTAVAHAAIAHPSHPPSSPTCPQMSAFFFTPPFQTCLFHPPLAPSCMPWHELSSRLLCIPV